MDKSRKTKSTQEEVLLQNEFYYKEFYCTLYLTICS